VVGVHVTGLYPAGVSTGFWDAAVMDRSAFTGDKSWLEPTAVANQVVAVLALPAGIEVPTLVLRQAGDVDVTAVERKLGLVRR
jgi:short-subunit dehydrogenase